VLLRGADGKIAFQLAFDMNEAGDDVVGKFVGVVASSAKKAAEKAM